MSNTPAMHYLDCNTFYATLRNTMCTDLYQAICTSEDPGQSLAATGHAAHPREIEDSSECLIE